MSNILLKYVLKYSVHRYHLHRYNIGSAYQIWKGINLQISCHYSNINHDVKKQPIKEIIKNGPSFQDFLAKESTCSSNSENIDIPYIINSVSGQNQTVFFKVHGCQMNVNDTEIVWSILKNYGYKRSMNINKADIILVVTCAIRDSAEQKIWNILTYINESRNKHKKTAKVGLLGCMAERLKHKLLDNGKLVDVVAGPDSYKDLPRLLALTDKETAINVLLSLDETYADILPVRLNPDAISAFVTIMRGCDNMCTYCIVPFTRGRERSRPIESIIKEIQHLSDQGIKEVTLLGQNVNSYRDLSQSNFYIPQDTETHLASGFKTVYKKKKGGLRFSDLLDKVSLINPEMRIRFTSPHPKDFPDEVLQLIKERPNICQQIHLPAQSGNSEVLQRMRRGYTRDAYLDLVHHIRDIIPDISLSSDFITGFCGETEEEFQDTLTLIELVKYNKAYLFAYSMREKTTAHRRYEDDVAKSVKTERIVRMMETYKTEAAKLNNQQIGQRQLILVEKVSKRSDQELQGKNDGNTTVVIPCTAIPIDESSEIKKSIEIGDYVVAEICKSTSHSLKGKPLYHSSISDFYSFNVSRDVI